MPLHPARRTPALMALAALVGIGLASIPAVAHAADEPVAVPVSPVDHAVLTEGQIDVVWSAPRDATGYEVRVGLDGGVDADGRLSEAPSTSTVATAAPLLQLRGLPQATYYWQVRACDADAVCGPWSQVRVVTVDLPGTSSGPQLDTLVLDDYVVQQPPADPAAAPGIGAIGVLSIVIAAVFSVLLLGTVIVRAVAVRVRT